MNFSPEVTTKQGRIKGYISSNYNGENFFNFLGVPYAKPPLGNLRFKDPEPPESWSGVFEATTEGSPCFQFQGKQILGSEDCLVLNVYSKDLKGANPVLFWVHGGFYVFGSGSRSKCGPEFLLCEDIVLVTINYRLGIFGSTGFKSTELRTPGNSGVKDIVMALRWVNRNIGFFGGDPGNVTLVGCSAGACAVHYLLVTELTRGLFAKTILQSGSALAPLAFKENNNAYLAAVLKINDEDELHSYLMNCSGKELVRLERRLFDVTTWMDSRYYFFSGTVEAAHEKAVISRPVRELIFERKYHKVPIIIGSTEFEGWFTKDFQDVETILLPMLSWKLQNPKKLSEVLEKVKKFYFGDGNGVLGHNSITYQICGDCVLNHGIYETVTAWLDSEVPIYLYKCTVDTNLNIIKKKFKLPEGMGHGDEIAYLFQTNIEEIQKGSKEEIAMKRFVKLWTNFAKYGNPTPSDELGVKWQPVTSDYNYLEIGDTLEMKENLDQVKKMQFWDQIHEEYYMK